MNTKGEICIGMVGAGRATELHMNALKRFTEVPYCLKHIVARRFEQVNHAKEKYGFLESSLDFENILNDPEIDIVDICTPPYAHADMIIKSLKAGKHVICEKPLSGYFGKSGDVEPIGDNVSKKIMYDEVIKDMNKIYEVLKNTDRKFMYAEKLCLCTCCY